MDERVGFALKVVGLSLVIGVILIPATGVMGLLLYILLDPLIFADDLASFMLFFLPALVFGVPAVVVASRLMLLRRRLALAFVLLGATMLLGALGFTGFWVGAMGI